MIEKVKISELIPNPKNPRIIKDAKFKNLVKSIKDFPEMLELRPIVVDENMVVLGGNMRLKACKEAGLKEVPVIKADNLTPDQQVEFIIKDNMGAGEWDWDNLANDWDESNLKDWGLIRWEIPDYAPILEPTIIHKDVTDDDIQKKAEELANQFMRESEIADVTCPHCGTDFKIQI